MTVCSGATPGNPSSMAMVVGAAIFILVTVGAAELVRLQCRRMLTAPRRQQRRPVRRTQPTFRAAPVRPTPSLRSVAGEVVV